jgi:hypothetical protein
MLRQQPLNFEALFRRSLLVWWLTKVGVGVCAMPKQQSHDLDMSIVGCKPEGRGVALGSCVDVGPMFQEELDDFRVPKIRSEVQWRPIEVPCTSDVHIGIALK